MSETPQSNKDSNKIDIPAAIMLCGGHGVTVRIIDERAEGRVRREEVKVRLIPLSGVTKYLDLVGDLTAFVEFVCGKEKGWADTVHPDDLFELEDECRRYNDPISDRWLRRQKATVERQIPKMREFKESTSTLLRQ